MLKASGRRWTVAALSLAAILCARRAFALEEVIDDFSDALPLPGTLLSNSPPLNILVDSAFTTETGTDTGITGVVGGVRELAVTITNCGACPFDNLIVGVVPASQLLDFSSSASADGAISLFYDGGDSGSGDGLNVDLSFALGIRVPLSNVDTPSYPLTIQMILGSGANFATRSFVFPPPGLMTMDVDFLFADFSGIAGIDLEHIKSIRINIDASSMQGAGDFQVLPISTTGTPPTETDETCLNGIDDDNDGAVDCNDPDCVLVEPTCAAPAPTLSPNMMVVLLFVLIAAGGLGIGRLRNRLD